MGRFCCGGCICEEFWIIWGEICEILLVVFWGLSGSFDCLLNCGVEVFGGVGWFFEVIFFDVFLWGRCSDFFVVLRGIVLRVFLEDIKLRKLFICEDVLLMLFCMFLVLKVFFLILFGFLSSVVIFLFRFLSLFFFCVNCFKVFFSDISFIFEGIFLFMRVVVFLRSFVRWVLKFVCEVLCFGKVLVIFGLKFWFWY